MDQEDPLEEELATGSRILTWEFHGQRNLWYSAWTCKSGTWLSTHTHTHMAGWLCRPYLVTRLYSLWGSMNRGLNKQNLALLMVTIFLTYAFIQISFSPNICFLLVELKQIFGGNVIWIKASVEWRQCALSISFPMPRHLTSVRWEKIDQIVLTEYYQFLGGRFIEWCPSTASRFS